jgi:hypothetical protein
MRQEVVMGTVAKHEASYSEPVHIGRRPICNPLSSVMMNGLTTWTNLLGARGPQGTVV